MPAAAAERDLSGQVALVTGASRGVGRGIADELAACGATVVATARHIEQADLPANIHRHTCDHTDEAQVAALFADIQMQFGAVDLLVNSAWGGYADMVDAAGNFTWPAPFWEQPAWRWNAMLDAGLRAAFVSSQHAVRLMLPRGRGLIVNVSYWAARKYVGNAIYGMAKAATDKFTQDAAHELDAHGITVVSLYPGLVRTELVLAAGLPLDNSESPQFSGRAIAALSVDPQRHVHTGQVLLSAQLARDYGFTDIDGSQPAPLTLADA